MTIRKAITVGFGLTALALMIGTVMAQPPATQNGVLVELFTSQGCSSCPPAEAVFNQMEKVSERAIPITFHVDYWDHLGWKDPFANLEYTDRQKEYGTVFNLRSIYTPQAVVSGRHQMNGSDAPSIAKAIGKEQRAIVSFDLKTFEPSTGAKAGAIGLTLHMKTHLEPAGDLVIYAAITESKLMTHIRAGENAGRELQEDHVVRRMVEVAGLTPAEASKKEGYTRDITLILDSTWKRNNLELVVFAQESDSLHILGAAQVKAF